MPIPQLFGIDYPIVSAEAEDPLPRGNHGRVFRPHKVKPGQDAKSIAEFEKARAALAAAEELVHRYPSVATPRPAVSYIMKETGVEPLPNVVNMQGQPMELAHLERVELPMSAIVSIYAAGQERSAS